LGAELVINDAGTIAVQAWFDDHGGWNIVTQDRVVAEFGQGLEGFTLGNMYNPRINNHGKVVFKAGLVELDQQALVESDAYMTGGATRILIAPGDTIERAPVVQLLSFDAMTDRGHVPVIVKTNTETMGFDKFFGTGDRILARPGDIVDGLTITGMVAPRLTNTGITAFLAAFNPPQDPSDILQAVIADDQVVLRSGDLLDGNRVEFIEQIFGINDYGDVAFSVLFEDDTEAVILGLATRRAELPGDANYDGVVDSADLAVLARNYGLTSMATWFDGDFDGNGRVNLYDLNVLKNNFGRSTTGSAAVIPEPSSAAQVLGSMLSALAVLWYRKTRLSVKH
jgi:hypothetical protein